LLEENRNKSVSFGNNNHTMNAIISSTGGRPGALLLSPSHKDRLVGTVRAWLDGELSLDEVRDLELCLPQHRSIALVVNNECNLNCTHCYLQVPDFAGIRLGSDDWAKVIDTAVASGVEQLLVVGKEALVGSTGPKVLAKLAEVRVKHPNLRTGLITNGHFLHKHWDLLESESLSHLDLSMEGDEEDHDAIRGTGSFAAVRDNLKKAAAILGERLFVTMTVQKRNLNRLDKALLAFADLGVRSVAFAPYKAMPYTDQSLGLSDDDLRDFFAGLKSLGELPLPHDMLIQVDACAACPEVLTQFIASDWFDLDAMVANGSGSLYLNRRLRNGLTISFRFQPWPLAFDYHVRIALDGSVVCSEDAYQPRSYTANRLANVRDFDFDIAKTSRAAAENPRLAAIDLRFETQTSPAIRQAYANRVASSFLVVEDFASLAGRELETASV
jgi:pyruvate-formate lyase-activating enzyme